MRTLVCLVTKHTVDSFPMVLREVEKSLPLLTYSIRFVRDFLSNDSPAARKRSLQISAWHVLGTQ